MEDGELPVGWRNATLANILTLHRGVTYRKPDARSGPENGFLPLLRANNINQTINFDDLVYVPEHLVSTDQRLRPFDIVIAMSSGSKKLVGKAAQIKKPCEATFGAFCAVARPLCGMDPAFVGWFMHTREYRQSASDDSKGSNINNLKREHILGVPIRVPPLPEQQRIVEKIETLFAELDKGEDALRAVQKLLARYRQSVLKAAVTGTLTADWRAANGGTAWRDTTLGELSSFLTSGSRGWAKFYADQGDTFIRAQNLKYDRLDLDDVAFVSLPNRSEGTRTKVQAGDILITITGANVTKTALVERIDVTAYVSQHVALFRPTSDVHPEFLHRFIVAKAGGRKALEAAAYGAGKPGLNLQNIKDVPISLPPLGEQREIVDRLDHLLGAQSAVQAEIKRQLIIGQSLRQSILKEAFSGKLVPQDPSDEPAVKLLERIRAARSGQPRTTRKKASA